MRDMRRFKQLMNEEDTKEVLRKGTHGVMAIMADDDYPYAVPVNYYYDEEENKLYFHGPKAGMRIDAMRNHDKCSFCVVDLDENDPEHYSTMYRSTICFGKPRLVENDTEEYARSIKLLTQKFVTIFPEDKIDAQIKLETPTCLMGVIDIEFMTGKESIEIVREKQKAKENQ